MSKSRLGHVHTEEQKMKIGKAVSGNKNGFFGKHHTEEVKTHLHDLFFGKSQNFTEEQKVNMRKTRFKKRGKYWGVSKLSGKPWWRVRIFVNGKENHIGIYPTEDDAAIAYNSVIHSYIPDAPLNILL